MSDLTVRLSHVALQVSDLPAMQRFYSHVLGLQLSDRGISRSQGREMVFLRGNGAAHHEIVLVSGAVDGVVPSRINHIAFTVDSLAALRAVRDRAGAAGAVGLRQIDHGNAWSVYFTDPEGNALEMFMDTPFYVPQPQGRALDLDLPDDVILAETEQAWLQDPGFLPRAKWEEVCAQLPGA